MRRAFLFLLLFLPVVTSSSCRKSEREVAPPPRSEKERLPEITQERVDLWIRVAADVGEYVRKFSLENEDVVERRSLMLIVHGSPRAQIAYSRIFERAGMTTEEFWNILSEMKRVKKYLAIKEEEKLQREKLDELIQAGWEEIEALERLEKEGGRSGGSKETIEAMKGKIREFEALKSDITPESVGVDREMIALWLKNRERFEKALSAMWKGRKRAEPDLFTHF